MPLRHGPNAADLPSSCSAVAAGSQCGIHIDAIVHAFTHTYLKTYMHTCIFIHTHAHTHTHTHTHTHAHTLNMHILTRSDVAVVVAACPLMFVGALARYAEYV